MSKKHVSHKHGHNHSAHGHHEADGHAPHGSLNSYLTGFGLSVVLTAIPFWLVMSGVLHSSLATGLTIMVFAVVQMVVHMVYFLHMHPRSEGGWTLLALGFTLILVIITMSGSMWVMYHLNTNMMPSHDMSDMPQTQPLATQPATQPEEIAPTPQTQQLP